MEIIVRPRPVPALVRNRTDPQGPWGSEQRNHALPVRQPPSDGA
jgi:hypothetical protein